MRRILYILLFIGVSFVEAKSVKHFQNNRRAMASYKDPVAVQNAFALLYHKYGISADTIAQEISEYFHKDPKMQMALACAYYGNNEYAKTRKYIAMAHKIDPKFVPAYILEGDLFGVGNLDSAIVYYNKAISIAPKEPDAYIRYANVMSTRDLNLAKSRLEDLRKSRPDYPVDVEIAGLYNNANDDASAAEAWAKTDPNTLSMNHLALYCQNLYWSKEHNDSMAMKVAEVGIRRFPWNFGFSRIYCWCATRAGEYKDALEKGKVWFQHTSNDSINSIDLYCLGTDYIGVGEVDKGYTYYAQIREKKDVFVSQMDNQIKLTMGRLVEEKKKSKDYEGAKAMYKKYMVAYPSKNNPDGQFFDYVDIYRTEVADLNEQKKTEERDAVLKQLLALYDEFAEKYPDSRYINYIYYYQAMYTSAILDPNNDQQLAKPYYLKLYEHITKKKEMSPSEIKMAVGAAKYIAQMAYFKDHDEAQAYIWFNKVLDLDPTNEMALKALTIIPAPKAGKGKKK